jgi:hypothetical protein
MPPSSPIQCCVNEWKEKIQPTFSNIDHGEGGRMTYFKMAKNGKSLIIFAPDCSYITNRDILTMVRLFTLLYSLIF